MGICLIFKSGGGTDTSNANVTADKILSGYTIYSNDNKITGTMTNVGAQTASGLNASGSTAIKAGWHDGNGSVTTNSLSSQTNADIPDASWCLSGYTYWKNGSKGTGTMANRGTKTWSIGANGSQTIEGGWHNGSGTVKQSINVDNGEWGPTPTTTNQQLCWQGWYYSKNRWCWGNGNLVAGNIKKGVSIFGVTGTWAVDPIKWVVKDGALCSGISLEYTQDYSPNDEGTPSSEHKIGVSPTIKKVAGNTYIYTMSSPGTNDWVMNCWYFQNVGGRLFTYTGSSTSDWKMASLHIDWAANGNESRNLCIYYAFGSSGGFSKIKNGAIWTWYSKTTTGSIDVTSVSSTKSGLPFNTGWSGKELQNGSILIGIPPAGSSYSTAFYIRNLWFDTRTWI